MPLKPSQNNEKVPRGRGAPSLGDDARIISLHCKISKNELLLWEKLAKKAGKTLGAFILEPIRRIHPTRPDDVRKTKKG